MWGAGRAKPRREFLISRCCRVCFYLPTGFGLSQDLDQALEKVPVHYRPAAYIQIARTPSCCPGAMVTLPPPRWEAAAGENCHIGTLPTTPRPGDGTVVKDDDGGRCTCVPELARGGGADCCIMPPRPALTPFVPLNKDMCDRHEPCDDDR